ncbi:MAG TPA: O-antigen ligase family protein [Chitinophagaceae bacterium]
MTSFEYKEKKHFIALACVFLLSLFTALWFQQYFFLLLPLAALLFYSGWQQPRIVFFLLLAALPFSFEYNFSPALGTDVPDEALMLLTSFLFLACWIYSPDSIPRSTLVHPLLILLLMHLGWTVLTSVLSTHNLLSVKIILAKGWYVGAFVVAPLIIFTNKKMISIAAIIIAATVFLVTIIAIYRHSLDGFSFATINIAVSPFFRNHVTYSSMLVCIIPVFFAIYLLNKNKRIQGLITAAILILLTALFFSYARGAWLALAAGAAAYWLVKKKLLVTTFIGFIFFCVAAVYWLKHKDNYIRYAHNFKTTIFHKDFKEHLVATYQLKDVSTAERFYRWIAGVRMIKDNYMTGYGPGTFYKNYKPYTVPVYKTWVSDNKEHSTVHNYFLLLLVEQGIPGLIFFLFLSGSLLYYAQHLYHRINDRFYRTLSITIGSILVMIITVNFLSDLIETDKIGSLFFLCLSLLVMTDINTKKLQAAPHVQSIS